MRHFKKCTENRICILCFELGLISVYAYLIFVMNAVNAVRVKFLAECKKIPEKNEKMTVLGKYVVNLRTFRV